MNILVLCTGNSARSILLESILNTAGAGRVTAYSAGSQPAGRVHPQSLALLEALGRPTDGLRSKSWDEFATQATHGAHAPPEAHATPDAPDAPQMDAVITVCGSAAAETCPLWPGAPVRAHWGVEDPAAAPEPDWEAAFQSAHDILERRAAAFLAGPIENMSPSELSAHLQQAGSLP